jgi:hypothetical protein
MSVVGTARVLLDEIAASMAAEAASGLVAGTALSALRDPALLRARRAKTLADLVATDLTAIDRTGARTLVRIADAFAEADPAALSALGLTRLTLLAEATPAIRATLSPSAGSMTTADLRRAVREAAAPRSTIDPLTTTAAATRYEEGDAARIAADLVRTATRALRDLDAAALRSARAALRLRDASVGLDAPAAEVIAIELGLGRADVERLYAIAERTVIVSTEVRERIGIRGLRAIASIEDDADREALIRVAAADPAVGAEQMVGRVRALQRERVRPAIAAPEVAAAAAPVQPAPFDVLFLVDRPSESERAIDATPVALVEQLVLRATAPSDTIVDLTAGMGTVAAVATRMGRATVSVDPIDPPLVPGIIAGDGRTAELPGGPFALAIIHPPLPGERFVTERYSGRTQPGDLSVLRPDGYLVAVRELIERAKELITPDGEIVLVARAAHSGGVFHDWPARFTHAAESIGLVAVDRLIVIEAPEERLDRERLEIGRAVREGRAVPVTLVAARFRLPTPADRRRR